MDIGKNLQASFDLYMKNFSVVFLSTLIAVFLSCCTFGILAGPLFGGLIVIVRKLINGEKTDINEVFAHFDQFVPTLIATLLLGVSFLIINAVFNFIPLIGWILRIALDCIFFIVFIMSIGLIIERKTEPIEALKQSFYYLINAKDPVNVWIYILIVGVIAFIGQMITSFIPLPVSVASIMMMGLSSFFIAGLINFIISIFTMPFGVLGITIAYQQLSVSEPAIDSNLNINS